ncbi:hypothetical protein KKG22_01860 [Patescibacteria group bacterium]|nr:hypothetical protein [Patescibacteria group bacterium]MBU1721900.1 hypothetical protein [Patescibacteria group bacterium]MBU1900868.1 hypothetical protein [Patescibacteria group bacterium]
MSEIKRKKNESFEAFFRRVKQQWTKSGKILQARKVQFLADKPSKNVQKTQAVERAKMNSKKTYLQKIGKLPPDEDKFSRNNK